MKLTKLLTGAAVAAITAGTAQAQVLQLDAAPYPNIPNPDAVLTAITGEANFAAEINSLSGINVPFEIAIGGGPAGLTTESNLEALIEIQLSGAIFDQTLSDADVVAAIAGGACLDSELSVDSGGTAGSSSVVFRAQDLGSCDANIAAPGGATDANLGFGLPLQLTGDAVDFTVSITRASNGNLIASGSYSGNRVSGTGGLVDKIFSAVDCTSTDAGATATAASFFADAGGFPLTVGDITCSLQAVLSPDVDAVAVGDVDEYNIAVTMLSSGGFDLDTSTIGGVTVDANGLVIDADLGAGALGAAQAVSLADGPGAIQVQELDYVATVDFDFGASFPSSQAVETDEGAFAQINREGDTTGVFEWVGQAGNPTRSIWRVTGLTSPFVEVVANVTGSTVIEDTSASLTGILGGTDGFDGELIITNDDITDAVGEFGRANVSFTFVTPGVAPTVGSGVYKTRRLLVGSNGTLTDFGNENDDDTNDTFGGADADN